MGFAIIILLLLIILIGLLIFRMHQFKQPRMIRWQIGHQIFTFQFPFDWMQFFSSRYFKDVITVIGLFVLGFIILAAVLVFLFLFLGIILPILLVIGLVALILFLLFVI